MGRARRGGKDFSTTESTEIHGFFLGAMLDGKNEVLIAC
jgi:hypothetical protein